jgi:hypothetical protein
MLINLFAPFEKLLFKCMAEEARLMSDLRGDHFETISVFSSYIRQSALRLTHYQGSEPDSIAAALLVCMPMPLPEQIATRLFISRELY